MKKGYCWCILIVASVHRRHERQPVYRSLQVLLLDIVKELKIFGTIDRKKEGSILASFPIETSLSSTTLLESYGLYATKPKRNT